jgi:uncharacterized protein YjeT (DUF2065 family)
MAAASPLPNLALPRPPISFGGDSPNPYISESGKEHTDMDTSIFLAQLLGPFFLVLGIGMAATPQAWRAMAEEFLDSRALIFLAGLFAFLPGLAIVLTHNVWVFDWRLIVTLLGWLGLAGGAFRLLFPMEVRAIGKHMLQKTEWLRAGGVAVAVLGAVLAYFGFVA